MAQVGAICELRKQALAGFVVLLVWFFGATQKPKTLGQS